MTLEVDKLPVETEPVARDTLIPGAQTFVAPYSTDHEYRKWSN